MQTHLDYGKAAPGSVQAMYKLQKYVDQSRLDHSLLELIKTRVSQMNGCACCFWRPVRESNPCRRREREAIYRNSTETCGMDSTVR